MLKGSGWITPWGHRKCKCVSLVCGPGGWGRGGGGSCVDGWGSISMCVVKGSGLLPWGHRKGKCDKLVLGLGGRE